MTINLFIFIKDSLFNAIKYGSNAIEIGYGVQPKSWIDDNCSKLYQRVVEIKDRILRFHLFENFKLVNIYNSMIKYPKRIQ